MVTNTPKQGGTRSPKKVAQALLSEVAFSIHNPCAHDGVEQTHHLDHSFSDVGRMITVEHAYGAR